MIHEINAFCRVVEHRSFAKAAKALSLSTSKITRLVQHLETSLNTTLLYRSTRDISLTEAGLLFYEQAIEILNHFHAGTKAVNELKETISGTVKIALPVSLNHLWVAPQLHKFQKKYPDVNIHIINGNHLLDMIKEGFDIVVHCGSLPDSSFYYKKIKDWSKLTCASHSYLKKHGTPKNPNDLSNHICLDHSQNFPTTWRYLINGKEHIINIQSKIKSNSAIALKTMVASGMGISCLPEFTIQKELDSGKIITLLDKFHCEKYGMYAVYPSKTYMSKKVKVMLDFIVEILQ